MKSILIYGGTFDPPHRGHISTAVNVQKFFSFEEVFFLPCKEPVLKKSSIATSAQRIDMLKLALLEHKYFKIDSREIERPSPSYMFETLASYRDQYSEKCAITFLLGKDAFCSINKWHRWEELINLANILVIDRPLIELDYKLYSEFLIQYETKDKKDLIKNPYGHIYYYNAGNYHISSTEIKKRIKDDAFITKNLSHSVIQYIKENKLYLI